MKKLISIILAFTLILSLATVASAATAMADSGWWDDDGQYDGWTLNDDGSMTLDQSKASGNCDDRIGHSIEDPNNFNITVTVKSGVNSCVLIKLFNVMVELNSEGASRDQFFVKNIVNNNWNNIDWLDAADFTIDVKLVRENGGNIKVTVTGKGNGTPIIMDLPAADPTGNNIELFMYDCGANSRRASATFSVDFGAKEPPVVEPQGNPLTSASGWWDDDGQYDGWTLNDDGSMTLDQSKASGAHDDRIGHAIEDPNNFEITVTVKSNVNSRVAIKLFNMFIELNSEGASRDQFFIKHVVNDNWNNHDWMDAADFTADVKLVRENGGNLKVTVTGKNNGTPITMDLPIADPTANNIELLMFDCGANSRRASATFSVDLGVEAPEEAPKTGDIAIAVPVALLVFSGVAFAVTIKKKED